MSNPDERCTIGTDCRPGMPRSDFYFRKVFRGTGLCVSDFDEPDKLFGAWTWHLEDAPQKRTLFLVSRSVFHCRLAGLVRKKAIRGAILERQGLRLVPPIENEQHVADPT
jgi:hypothetical protein